MKIGTIALTAILATSIVSCNKKGCTDPLALNYAEKAKKDDGSCQYKTEDPAPAYTTPSTYAFTDANGNSTVSYSGQAQRLDMLREMVTYMKDGKTTQLDAQKIKDMFANANNQFTDASLNTAGKQLKDKCFSLDQAMFEGWMDDLATASASNASMASSGQAGKLTSGTSTYLVDANGIEHVQLIEKGLMGAVFMYQALNYYFSDGEMNVDNTTAVDAANGKYYTLMQHHWDEAFGYFGVSSDFPTTVPTDFWGKYCNSQNTTLNSNADMMNNFLKGRAAIGANVLVDRDAAILAIQNEWEEISANQAIKYLGDAVSSFSSGDNAKGMHNLSEAYAFVWNIRYAPDASRNITTSEHTAIMAMFNSNFWNMSLADITAIKDALDAKY